MYKRLASLPAHHSESGQVSAQRYDQVQTALRYLEPPLRFAIPTLRNLQMIVDNESWVCVDASLNNLPVAAWTAFQTQERGSLHGPVACRISHYHTHAGLVMETALCEMEKHLAQALLPAG